MAVFDVDSITGPLEVRYATGDEDYLTFAGDIEHPAPGEVIFADQAGEAHARRWTNRQSGRSAVRDSTATALIVAEALHDQAPARHPPPNRRPGRRATVPLARHARQPASDRRLAPLLAARPPRP